MNYKINRVITFFFIFSLCFIFCCEDFVTEEVKVTFLIQEKDRQGETSFIHVIKKGQKITKPDDPIRENYTFQGWYKEQIFKNPFDFKNEVVEEDITLYGQLKKAAIPPKTPTKTPEEKEPEKTESPYSFGEYVDAKSFVIGNATKYSYGITFHEEKFYITADNKKLLVYNKQGSLLTEEGFSIDFDSSSLFYMMVRANGLFYVIEALFSHKPRNLLVYNSSGEKQTSKSFNLEKDVSGICFYNNFFYMTDNKNEKVIVYDRDGSRDSSKDFNIVDIENDVFDNIRGIVAVQGKFFIVIGKMNQAGYVQVYQSGSKIQQFRLNNKNINPYDVTYHDQFIYIADVFRTSSKVFAYFVD